METTGVRSNTTQTDLNMLVECLKFQMKSPELQKQTLLTIQSICEGREDNVELLRGLGGVTFILNLSRSSILHSDVKETALFTLGTLAEANEFCKHYLCTKETFAEVAAWLMNEEVSLTQRRMSVYLLSVLVANNKLGQSLAQTTGCLDVLLKLFRNTFPLAMDSTVVAPNDSHVCQLWASLSNALCACVNNPQNAKGQLICAAAFPALKTWLQIALVHKEVFQSICSFIAMTVANNSSAQERFSATGCLETLTISFLRLTAHADTNLLCCQLSVTASKTLSACITENSALASGLAQFDVVTTLLCLLASPNLEPHDMLSILLMLSYCTESSEEHQLQFVQYGGLPLIITLLTEDTSEEVRKATAFILHTCKQATMSLGEIPMTANIWEDRRSEPPTNMENLRNQARDLLSRINLLEHKHVQSKQDDPATTAEEHVLTSPLSAIPLHLLYKERIKEGREPNKADSHILKPPTSVRHSSTKEIKHSHEVGFVAEELCPGTARSSSPQSQSFADLQSCVKSCVKKLTAEEYSLLQSRCAGCVLLFEEVTSRTFLSLQRSFHQSCDMHKALHAATEGFRTGLCSLLLKRDSMTERVSAAKRSQNNRSERREKGDRGCCVCEEELKTETDNYWKKENKDFCPEEVHHQSSGVKRFGLSWSSILSSYHPGSTRI